MMADFVMPLTNCPDLGQASIPVVPVAEPKLRAFLISYEGRYLGATAVVIATDAAHAEALLRQEIPELAPTNPPEDYGEYEQWHQRQRSGGLTVQEIDLNTAAVAFNDNGDY